ncbi:MAG: aspartate/glutamate racemase family protein [Zoogloea sp.]|uniref:aspartate/glutamate racemase family protein n=1 Tax=Zoogloea sp. TaxID=49181 RepID=UPI003F339023
MKKIGLIGGLGPDSTIDYYRRITSHFRARNPNLSSPEILIYSTDLAEFFDLSADKDSAGLCQWLLAKIQALQAAGADFAAISSNMPHVVFDEVQAQSSLPLISIVEVTLAQAQRLGLKKLALLGTAITLRAGFFQTCFARAGIEVITPNAQEQAFIHEKLQTEIVHGLHTDATRAALVALVESLREREGIEAVILGCTELPRAFNATLSDVHLLNTTELHVQAICDFCSEAA